VLLRNRFSIVMLWTIAAILLLANNAMAYIGPGAGMEFIGYAMSLVAMVGIAFFSILMWPFYSFIRWLRGTKTPLTTDQSAVSSPITDVSPTPVPASVVNATNNQPASPSVP